MAKITDLTEELAFGKVISRPGRLFPIRMYTDNFNGYFVECRNEHYVKGEWIDTNIKYAVPIILTYHDLIAEDWKVCN